LRSLNSKNATAARARASTAAPTPMPACAAVERDWEEDWGCVDASDVEVAVEDVEDEIEAGVVPVADVVLA